MTKTVSAIYEHGVLKLDEPVSLGERTRIQVVLQIPDEDDGRDRAADGLREAHLQRSPKGPPPGAGIRKSGHHDTAERAKTVLGELGFGEDKT